jgi:hypothetical protein
MIRRLGAVTAAGVAAFVVGAAPASALPILERADATELAQALAEATEEQDVCYGWSVQVEDYSGGNSGLDVGSSLGVGKSAISTACDRYVVFEAFIVYTSEASEAEDSASYEITSNIPGAPEADDLRRFGISSGGLLGGKDDEVLANAALALPALLAEKGLADPIVLEPNTAPLPSGDKSTGTPGSDWLRKYGAMFGIAALVLVGGLAWAGWVLFYERPFGRSNRPTPGSGATQNSPRRIGGLPE